MGFDGNLLKTVLESFVDEMAEESAELILERPRYAYAVVLIADDQELCEASCVRQLDVEVSQPNHNSSSYQEDYDSDIQRALRELKESRDLLATPRGSVAVDSTSVDLSNYNDASLYDISTPQPFTTRPRETSNFFRRLEFPSTARFKH
ncbi:unnamed protein product [Cylicocyclus nassatus]|uniref:Uncharacterized protein n=1 Tax=Cylicocyclus nassatus TaxID=53992 RepID=A0AA36GKD8_CYLNA|nr:unnamed protein product [Cylicocyclus nassatus]